MERPMFDDVIRGLRKYDPYGAECILSSMEGIEQALDRDLSEDEKMIAYSMYMSGLIAERYTNMQREMDLAKISLN